MLTHQEIFDKSCSAIIAQGKAARNGTACAYAGPNGTACAIGQLLPRDVAEEWEASDTFSVSDLRGKRPIVTNARKKLRQLNAAGVPTDSRTMDFLEELQRAHDRHSMSYNFVSSFRESAREVAQEFNLSIAVLGEL